MQTIEAEVAYPIKSVHGEGAVWDADTQKLLWVDIIDHKIYAFDPSKGSNIGFDIGQDVGTVVVTESGLWAYADTNGIGFLNSETGKITHGALPEEPNSHIRFNDGKCDPRGDFWAGTMAYDCTEGAGKLYAFGADDSVEVRIPNTTISNGLVWSKNQEKFYFIDSLTYEVHGYDYDNQTGKISNKQVVASLDKNKGLPDGMAIDAEDHLWVALFDGGKVIRINPHNGHHGNGEINFTVKLPVPKITSCAFGGENLDELYITTSSYLMEKETLEKHPHSGSLFKVKVPFQGVLSFKMKNY